MSGPKRNPDYTNTIGVVVVGICGAVLVYVTIVALQAFYMNDTENLQHTADYGGQEATAQKLRSDQLGHIGDSGQNTGAPTFHIPIDVAMQLVVRDAKADPSHLIPALPPSTTRTIEPIFGRPPIGGAGSAATPPAAGTGSGAAPAEQGSGAGAGAGSAAGAGAGAGSAAATGGTGTLAPLVPTGAGGGPSPVGGAGSLPSGNATRGATTTGAAPVGAGTGSAAQPKATQPKTEPKAGAGSAAQPKAPKTTQPKTEPKGGAGKGSGAK